MPKLQLMFDLVLVLAVSRFLGFLYCDLSDLIIIIIIIIIYGIDVKVRRLYVWIGMAPSCK